MNIIEISVSLMTRKTKVVNNEADYIVKCTAKANMQEYSSITGVKVNNDLAVQGIVELYNDLVKNTMDITYDSVGVWVKYDDGTMLDKAMSIQVIDDIRAYSYEKIDPIEELAKMALMV